MVRILASIVVAGSVFMYTGCAGPTGPALSPGFNGVWTGKTVIAPAGVPEATVAPTGLWVDASGPTANVQFVCPGLDGEIVATGDGDVATWTGNLECAPVASDRCEATRITITSATFRYDERTSEMTMEATGTVSGCGVAGTPSAIVFHGSY